MASNDEKGSDLLICPVCSQEYNTPKFISCGHSVCMEPCLQNLLRSSSPGCPVCDSKIQSTCSGSAKSFPTNLVVEALLSRSKSDLAKYASTSNVKKHVETKLCQLHEENLDKFCETCSELICEKCVTEVHDQLHEISSVTEAAEKFLGRLKGIEEELKTADERLDKVSETLENAKLKCKTDSDSIKREIIEAQTWASQLVKNCAVDLSTKIDERKEKVVKEIQNTESQRLEALLFSSYLKNVCDSLKNDPQGYNVTSKGVVDNLSKKTETLFKDISGLEKANVPGGIGLSFRAASSNDLERSCLGTLESGATQRDSSLPACKQWTCVFINDAHKVDLSETYMGFAWVEDINYSKKINITKHKRSRKIVQADKCLYINACISIISPSTDIRGLGVLGHSGTTVYKISFCPSSKSPSIVERKFECTTENEISAVSWDENRTDCYALLKDGIIFRVNFSGLVRRDCEVKLDEPVVSVTSRQFHVSELGRMAICETGSKRVRYFESVQAKPTKIVTAPPDIKDWYPVFVISRKYDQRWFVAWETLSYEIEEDGVPYARIYQYGERFDLEGLRFKLACHNIKAFSFSDNNIQHNGNGNRLELAVEKILYHSRERIISVYEIDAD